MRGKERKEFIACMAKNPKINCRNIKYIVEKCEDVIGEENIIEEGPTILEKRIYKIYKKNKDVVELMDMYKISDHKGFNLESDLRYRDINGDRQRHYIPRLDNKPQATDSDYVTKIKWWERQCKYDALIAENATECARIEKLVVDIVKKELNALEQRIKANYPCEVAQINT